MRRATAIKDRTDSDAAEVKEPVSKTAILTTWNFLALPRVATRLGCCLNAPGRKALKLHGKCQRAAFHYFAAPSIARMVGRRSRTFQRCMHGLDHEEAGATLLGQFQC